MYSFVDKLTPMKKLLVLVSVCTALFAFTFIDNVPNIVNALRMGNAEEVSRYFDNFIDLKLLERDEIKNMSKNQAGFAFQSFFRENGIRTFELTSQREMGGVMYLAGRLINSGRGYNITILLKNKDGGHQIITVRIN